MGRSIARFECRAALKFMEVHLALPLLPLDFEEVVFRVLLAMWPRMAQPDSIQQNISSRRANLLLLRLRRLLCRRAAAALRQGKLRREWRRRCGRRLRGSLVRAQALQDARLAQRARRRRWLERLLGVPESAQALERFLSSLPSDPEIVVLLLERSVFRSLLGRRSWQREQLTHLCLERAQSLVLPRQERLEVG